MAKLEPSNAEPICNSQLEPRYTLWQRILRSAPVLAGAMFLSLILNREGLLRHFEAKTLDLQTRLQASRESGVALVLITDEDYRRLFKGQSPLDPFALGKLVEAVKAARPKVIGIDIDTSDSSFQSLDPTVNGPPVIWGQPAAYSPRTRSFRVFDVLGRENGVRAGLIVFKVDADGGVVRRYRRTYPTDRGSLPSLPWAVATVAKGIEPNGLGPREEDRLIRYATPLRRTVLPASTVLSLAAEEGWLTDSPLRGKTVLIGGDYAAQDEHNSPLGWMLGIEILAQVVETELLGGGERGSRTWVLFPLQLLGGLPLVLLFYHLPFRRALLLSLLLFPLLAMVCSFFAFLTVARWSYFIPCLVGITLQELYMRALDLRDTLIAPASPYPPSSEPMSPLPTNISSRAASPDWTTPDEGSAPPASLVKVEEATSGAPEVPVQSALPVAPPLGASPASVASPAEEIAPASLSAPRPR